jgi:hypothetical protein
MNDIEVGIVYEAPGLPYSADYRTWSDHVDGCAHCVQAIKDQTFSFEPRDPSRLCDLGRELDSKLAASMVFQRETSRLN